MIQAFCTYNIGKKKRSHILYTRVTENQDKKLLDGFFLMDNKKRTIHIQQPPDVIWQKMTSVISTAAEETADIHRMNSPSG